MIINEDDSKLHMGLIPVDGAPSAPKASFDDPGAEAQRKFG